MGMLKEPRYDTSADVALRLNGTVCMYQKRPVYVSNENQRLLAPGDLTVNCFDLLSQKELDPVHTSDEDFEVRAIPLGFVNKPHHAMYVCRLPTRKQRQGLSPDNGATFQVGADMQRNMQGLTKELLRSKGLGEMIMRQYPSIDECYEKVRKGQARSIAFAPRFVLTVDDVGLVKVSYFTMPIAMYSKGRFMLTEKYEHYLPLLKRLSVPCEVMDI